MRRHKDGNLEMTDRPTAERLKTKASLTVRKGYERTPSVPAKLYNLPEKPKLLN